MAAILPTIEAGAKSAKLSRYFLPYQLAWIQDDHQMRLAEKSVRIGWTFADAFKNVRKRLDHPRRDYLFSTKDQPTAFEYVQTCYRFAEVFDLTKSILTHGIESWQMPDAERGKGFTQEVKVGVIKFDNGSRILAFSSNPNALRAYGGDVGLDEFAFHPDPEALWAAASGRVTWGFDLGVWSSHNGDGTLFWQFAQEAAAGKGGWHYYRVTMPDAIEAGLVDRINKSSGKNFTPADFLEDCRRRARLPEVFEQEYLCNPAGGTAAIVPWTVIESCKADYPIGPSPFSPLSPVQTPVFERAHLDHKEVLSLFSDYQSHRESERTQAIEQWVCSAFAATFAKPFTARLGFDVAASGGGDLGCIWVDEKRDNALWARACFTTRTEDWHFLKVVLKTFLRRLSACHGLGDMGGIGRQICWEAERDFPGIFAGCLFAQKKTDIGTWLMNQLAVQEKRFPRDHLDIAQDFFSIRKTYQGRRLVFSEQTNPLNLASHCDIAWAAALASWADKESQTSYGGTLC